MKQNNYFQRMLSAMILLMASSLSWAYDFKAENADGVTIYYNLINNGTEAEVTYETMNFTVYFDEVINIPETVEYDGKTLNVTSIGYEAFMFCSDLISVTIPNSVTSIGSFAFYGCEGLTSINIPEGVTIIGHSAFYRCSSLTSVTIPNGVIGLYAFSNCSGLTSVTIGNSVTSIGYEAFYGCSSLTSVTIPESVTSISGGAFSDCSSLTSVYSLIENPFGIASDVFSGIADDATLYVPQGTKDAYEATDYWTTYFSNVVELNATGISEVNPGQTAEGYAVYNLNGTKVSVKDGDLNSLPRGIYVVNGKKTIVK